MSRYGCGGVSRYEFETVRDNAHRASNCLRKRADEVKRLREMLAEIANVTTDENTKLFIIENMDGNFKKRIK